MSTIISNIALSSTLVEAQDEWGALLDNHLVGSTPALRNLHEYFNVLHRNIPCGLTDDGCLPDQVTDALISTLSDPKMRIADITTLRLIKRPKDPLPRRIRALYRIHVLCRQMELVTVENNKLLLTQSAESFLRQSEVQQYITLLWTHLASVPWSVLYKNLPEYHQEMTHDLQIADVIQRELSVHVRDFLVKEPDENGWKNLSWFSEEAAPWVLTGQEPPESLFLDKALEREVFLWDPFCWFGLLKPWIAVEQDGSEQLIEVSVTALGQQLLPVFADATSS